MHPLLQKLKNNRLMGVRQDGPLPQTKPKWNGFGRKGFKPVGAVTKITCTPVAEIRPRNLRTSRFDRNDRAKLARVLEDFRRRTRTKGPSGRTNQGALTPAFVEVVKTLAFDFWNAKTGRLDPSHETIAEAAGFSIATVRRALKAAARAGVLNWVRRPAVWIAGQWKRRSNSYQFAVGTTVKIQDSRIWGSPGPLPYLETQLRESAASVGCKFLT